MADVQGTCEGRFAAVRTAFASALDSGAEAGASVCVIHDGQVVVDLWGGVADVGDGTPWSRHSLVNTFSITKTMTALAALVLVERRALDLDVPLAAYWPEFASGGKQDVLVRHVLGHTSGLSGWQHSLQLEDLYDHERCVALLAEQEPWWGPGTSSGYHAMTQGHLVGELVRRVTGRSLGEFFGQEIAAGADFHIGTPADVDDRVARLVPPPPSGVDLRALPEQSVIRKTLTNPTLDLAKVHTREWRNAELGAMNGHGNARSVAQVQCVISHGGDGLLRARTIERIFDVQADGVDQVLGRPVRFGIGYALSSAATPELPDGRVCWWTGYGGSLVVNDLDRRLTFAYVMNRMGSGLIDFSRSADYLRAVYEGMNHG